MKLKSYLSKILFILIFACGAQINSQSIQNIIIEQLRDTVKINYDLVSIRNNDVFEIQLSVSNNNGETFDIIPHSMIGNFGFGVKPKRGLAIKWMPLKDSVELVGDNYIFKLRGELLGTSKKIDFVKIKGGTFFMGSNEAFAKPDERKVHKVNLDDFEMSVYEITNIQYLTFLNDYKSDRVKSGEYKNEKMIYTNKKGLVEYSANGNHYKNLWMTNPGYEYFPVVGVTWYGANEFCKFYGYRLPTEAEWEYAAREGGKENVLFGNGTSIADPAQINFDGSSKEKREYSLSGESRKSQIRVANFKPNKLRLFDMSGNVWEWCQDWYQSNYYYHSRTDNPTGPWFGNYKVIRGGSWFNNAEDIRVTDRSFYSPFRVNNDIGFRVVRMLKGKM